ncbi:MAG: tRNA lysidine(34) synthetase TilS [Phycisphaerae bacterium]|nr:tRNA lysidine(34) synthetase TilS [Phycisphaerae bacterium]
MKPNGHFPMSGIRLIRALAEQIEAEDLFDRQAAVVVGVSGGLDSMALLHALVGLNRHAGYSLALHVAHLNHGLRGAESDSDAAFVQSAAAALDLPCTVERIDVPEAARSTGESVEETARRCRYAFYERVCAGPASSKLLAIGHTANDNAETVLHRVIRGTGWRGMAAIPRRRPIREQSPIEVVRPILRFTREELRVFLDGLGVSFRHDRTNESTEPMRNRIRNIVLPLLREQLNPQVDDALLRLAEQARWVDEFLRETVDPMFETLLISRNDQEISLNAASMAGKPRIVQAELIRRAVRGLGVGERRFTHATVIAVTRLLQERTGTQELHLPDGVTVMRVYDRLIFSRPADEPREELAPEVRVNVPGHTSLPMRHIELECRVAHPAEHALEHWRSQSLQQTALHAEAEEWLDLDAVHLPLTVRNRQAGDRFWPLGAPGTRKLSDFLIDAKVPLADRDAVTLLCDHLGPIYIIGYRIDDRVKLTASTRRVLEIRVRSLRHDG